MDIFTLGADVKKVVEGLRAQYGGFVLAMLYNSALEADSNWNLIVSAPWADRMGAGQATRIIAHALNQGLRWENQRAISRITVLKITDLFVRDMIGLYPGTTRPVPVAQVTAGEVNDGSGLVLYSARVHRGIGRRPG
jgi:hypothetical protein